MAGADLESLLRGIEAIYADLGEPAAEGRQTQAIDPDACLRPLDPASEAQIAAVLRTLGRIADAASQASALPPPPPNALGAALGGAALLMRSDFILGRAAEIPSRLPAFAYLTTLIFLDQAEGQRRSREVEALLEAEGFSVD